MMRCDACVRLSIGTMWAVRVKLTQASAIHLYLLGYRILIYSLVWMPPRIADLAKLYWFWNTFLYYASVATPRGHLICHKYASPVLTLSHFMTFNAGQLCVCVCDRYASKDVLGDCALFDAISIAMRSEQIDSKKRRENVFASDVGHDLLNATPSVPKM